MRKSEIPMNKKKSLQHLMIFALIIGLSWIAYTYTPLRSYLSLGYMQEKSSYYKTLLEMHYYTVVFCYIAFFIFTVALSMPSSIILTLLGGSLFGVLPAVLYATISVVIGMMIACTLYRIFFFKTFEQMYADRITTFKHSMQEYGVSYLLMLHFSAVFPYFVINSIALLAQVPMRTILWTAVVGFLPQAFVYAFAGQKLSSIRSVRDIFSPQVVAAFLLLILLACVPIFFKKYKNRVEL